MMDDCPLYLLSRRREAEERCDALGLDLWRKGNLGKSTQIARDPALTAARERVWAEMRRMGLSFPEIAQACGMTSHASIVAALIRMERRGEFVKVNSKPPKRNVTTADLERTAKQAKAETHDNTILEAVRDAWRLYAVFEDPAALDCVLELLDADAAKHDPDYKRPSVMRDIDRAKGEAA